MPEIKEFNNNKCYIQYGLNPDYEKEFQQLWTEINRLRTRIKQLEQNRWKSGLSGDRG